MGKLYVIGNGFDLAHYIPSKYCDFQNYCQINMRDMYDKLENLYGSMDGIWSDFEKEMPNINMRNIFNLVTVNNNNWNRNRAGYYRFIDDVRNEVDYIDGIKSCFTEWIQSITLNDVYRRYDLPVEDALYLTFNYTLTLEEIYHIPQNIVCHIHGKVMGRFPQLVVGHNMRVDEIERNFESDNEFEIEACKEIVDLVRGWRKDTDRYIRENEDFFNRLHDVTEIYVLGHSMNEIDMPYFHKIQECVGDNACWHISVYDGSDRVNKEKAITQLGLHHRDFINLEDLAL